MTYDLKFILIVGLVIMITLLFCALKVASDTDDYDEYELERMEAQRRIDE